MGNGAAGVLIFQISNRFQHRKALRRKIMEKALSFSTADTCVINLNGSESGNIRYARNTVSTSGHRSNQTMAVQSSFGKKSGISYSYLEF